MRWVRHGAANRHTVATFGLQKSVYGRIVNFIQASLSEQTKQAVTHVAKFGFFEFGSKNKV
jgi:hypothetical protein